MADPERRPIQPPRDPQHPNTDVPHRDEPEPKHLPEHVEPDREWPKPPPKE